MRIWRAFAVNEPKNRPEERLAIALEMALEKGYRTECVIVADLTAAETKTPTGVTLVGSAILQWWEYRFELHQQRSRMCS
jgi:hypothetical protein